VWVMSVHWLVPDDAPLLLSKPAIMTTYVDANLYYDLITSHVANGILHLVNSTLVAG